MAGKSLDHVPAWRAGAGGGAVASIGQFIGVTFNECLGHLFAGEFFQAMTQFSSFLIGMAIMSTAGAVIAFFMQAKTTNRWTLFLAGCAFVSIGTTALPGFKQFLRLAEYSIISPAYADDQCRDVGSAIYGGVKQFFGLDEGGYRVVAGSFKSRADAENFANKINAADSTLKATAGDRAPCNDFYPVYVGPDSSTLEEAKKTQSKVLKIDVVPGAFISKRQYN